MQLKRCVRGGHRWYVSIGMNVGISVFLSANLCADEASSADQCPQYGAIHRYDSVKGEAEQPDKHGSRVPTQLTGAKQLKIVGRAHDFDGALLYCEYHSKMTTQQANEQEAWLVEYYGIQEQAIIAKKTLVYQPFDVDAIAPEVEQVDYRTQELRRSVYAGDNIELFYQQGRGQPLDTQSLAKTPLPVIDAGFDYFVRAHWSALIGGQPVLFDFGSIAHLRSLPLRVIKKPLNNCSEHDEAFMCLHVQASNRFLRWFVGELALVYDAQRRLRVFKGAVNLQNDQAKAQKAVITYSYR